MKLTDIKNNYLRGEFKIDLNTGENDLKVFQLIINDNIKLDLNRLREIWATSGVDDERIAGLIGVVFHEIWWEFKAQPEFWEIETDSYLENSEILELYDYYKKTVLKPDKEKETYKMMIRAEDIKKINESAELVTDYLRENELSSNNASNELDNLIEKYGDTLDNLKLINKKMAQILDNIDFINNYFKRELNTEIDNINEMEQYKNNY
jgi:hypothetical protein